jgi:predicted DNA-binding transcriptional regulator AlpA
MDNAAVVDWKGLTEEFGWPYSRTHTWRLMAAGKFPQCFKLVDSRNSHPLWTRREIIQFLTPSHN